MAGRNMFDAPIPGQSLTDEPGNAKWEKPARFARPQEALDYIWNQLNDEKHGIKLLALLEAGLPAQGIAETVLFAGFSEGLWTPDVMLIIGKPVFAMVCAMGKRAGIKVTVATKDRDELDEFLSDLAKTTKKGKGKLPLPEADPAVDPAAEDDMPPAGGLMSKGIM